MTRFIVGVDGGTQSSKVAVFDIHGRVVCEASQPLRPLNLPEPGVVEHPDDDLYDSVVAAAAQAMARFPGDPADIVGIGLCSIRCCRALVRDDLTLAAPVQSWMDERLSRPYEHDNADVAHVTTASGYLMGRLTGQRVDTAANYIGPWPMDVRTWDWFTEQDVFDSYGVPREMLYRLQLPGDIGGTLTEGFAAATGIPAGIPVVHTANDKATEALGSGLRDERTGLISLGTYIAGMVQGHEYVAEPSSYFTNFACQPHTYLYESAGIRRGMWTVSWLRDLLDAQIAPAVGPARANTDRANTDRANTDGTNSDRASSEDRLNAAAARVPAGSDGLLCLLDWLAPPTVPFRKGLFIGLDERHGYGHLYRAILEGIAFTMHRNMAAVQAERQVTLDKLVVSGGGSHSDVCMQIFADVFGVTTVRNEIRDSAGLGAAICAAVACGIYPDFATAGREMVHPHDVFSPQHKHRDLYTQLGAIHGDLSSHVDPILMRVQQALAGHQEASQGGHPSKG